MEEVLHQLVDVFFPHSPIILFAVFHGNPNSEFLLVIRISSIRSTL